MKFEDLENDDCYLIEKSPELYLSDVGWVDIEGMVVKFKRKFQVHWQDFSTRHQQKEYIYEFYKVLGTANSEQLNNSTTVQFSINARNIKLLEDGEIVFRKL